VQTQLILYSSHSLIYKQSALAMACLSVKRTPPLKVSEMHHAASDPNGIGTRVPSYFSTIRRQHWWKSALSNCSGYSGERGFFKRIPDAAPYLMWSECFDLKPFGELELWKQALVGGYGE
jgi:hypothetical protein